jgi:hypothetical protein
MGKAVFISIIIIHGLIHLMGFAKSFGLLRITELSQDISKPLGLLWLLSAILFFSVGILYLSNKDWWWIPGIFAIILSLNKLIISSNISCFHSISFYSRTAYLLIITSLCNSGWRWVTSLKAACFLYCGQRDFTSSPGSKPPMSSWVFALNSFVLPIQEVKRQSCSLAGSLP